MAANLLLASRWLREQRLPAQGTFARRCAVPRAFGQRTGKLGLLVWQETRQSTTLTLAILATLLPAALYAWIDWLWPAGMRTIDRWMEFNFVQPIFATLALAFYFSPVLLGSTIFLGDQTGHHFRFLGERGFPPQLVWLSRHIRCLVVMLIGILLFLPPAFALFVRQLRLSHSYGPPDAPLTLFLESLFGYIAVAYCCGQFCSMAIRSGILAVAAGGVATAVICVWAGITKAFGMSWLWTVAPLPVAFLASTWLQAPDWLVERKTWCARLRPAFVIAIPAAAILTAIPLVRIYEVPWVDPGFDPAGKTWSVSPEGKKALALYREAIYQKTITARTLPAASPPSARTAHTSWPWRSKRAATRCRGFARMCDGLRTTKQTWRMWSSSAAKTCRAKESSTRPWTTTLPPSVFSSISGNSGPARRNQ